MKKIMAIAGVLILILIVSGPALCELYNCSETPGVINRGNEDAQNICLPFDFENPTDYVNLGQNANRAVFQVDTCIPDAFFDLQAGDRIGISMDILDGFVKSPNFLLRCILRFFKVR